MQFVFYNLSCLVWERFFNLSIIFTFILKNVYFHVHFGYVKHIFSCSLSFGQTCIFMFTFVFDKCIFSSSLFLTNLCSCCKCLWCNCTVYFKFIVHIYSVDVLALIGPDILNVSMWCQHCETQIFISLFICKLFMFNYCYLSYKLSFCSLGSQSDVLRLEIVYKEGGIYLGAVVVSKNCISD